MWNIFEHWWTALLAAAIAQMALAIIHVIKPDSRKFWHMAIPFAIILIGIGIERTVQTDMEKINVLIKQCLTYTADENIKGIEVILAPDYSDSRNTSKNAAMEFCNAWLGRQLIAQNKMFSQPEIILSAPKAQIKLIVVTHIDPRSKYYDSVKLLIAKVELDLERNSDRKWLVKKAELLELNNQAVRWSDIH